MTQKLDVVNLMLCLAGGAVGGAVGYAVFAWLYSQGFYALVIPGACIGLGCGAFSRRWSYLVGTVAGLASLAWSLLIEWWFRPFLADGSLKYFFAHVHQLEPVTWIMVAFGVLMGFWFGCGREGGPWKGSASSK